MTDQKRNAYTPEQHDTSPVHISEPHDTSPVCASKLHDASPAHAAAIEVGATLAGFRFAAREELTEIDGTALIARHEASGARLLLLQNDDENKAFSITFKTPPGNDTGVFHILEHSVLCGSERFPVKEPFVNLLKTSMQTFLNAMTFPDKTMYPVASTNEQDLLNLMDVYMDAVLHPAIYTKEDIFRQEGWHYEVEGPSEEPRLTYNGVVFNEMKGALSNPESVLFDALQAELFPQTAYRFESGGTPQAIPELTYEMFLDEHRRHYRLDNSYIVLYGNLDAQRVLTFLDERYLTPWAREHANTTAKRPHEGPRALELQSPVISQHVVYEMDTAPENACCALASVVGTAADSERLIATDILLDALTGSNEAPLKRAIMEAGIADDMNGQLIDHLLQPFAALELRGAHVGALEELERITTETVERLVREGIDRALLEASLAHAEFVMREHDFGVADGVALAMSAMAGWLYDEDDSLATAYIRYEDTFAALRAKLDSPYFENLARELFLESTHRTSVEVRPVEAAHPTREERALAHVLTTLDAHELSRITAEADALHAAQETPDTPEALATLPSLSVDDIGPAKQRPAYHVSKLPASPATCIRHDVNTNGIAYAFLYFDVRCVAFEELPYLGILTALLGKLDTARHTAAQLDTLIQARLGNLGFIVETHAPDQGFSEHDDIVPYLLCDASALTENIDDLYAIPAEVMRETDFSNTQKILEILTQQRFALEQGFSQAGHACARRRALSYFSRTALITEQLSGVEFYRFLKDLLAHYDERADALTAKLTNLAQRIFADTGLTLSFSGPDEALDAYLTARKPLGSPEALPQLLTVPQPYAKREAFIVPSDVSYSSLCFNWHLAAQRTAAPDAPYDAAWNVAARALNFEYLWNEVRVKGGAYGVGFRATRKGTVCFHSYRDPRIDETINRFAGAAAWLATFEPTKEEMDGYIVSSVSDFDAPLKARGLARRQDGDYFAGRASDWHARARAEVIAATPEKIRELAALLKEASAMNALCTFGGKDIIEASALDFDVIDLFNEEV